jgi:AcrR family transcriptional regulator
LRAESADETRRRILDALYARLRDAPTRPVSIEEVARAARVSRSTVYLAFGSRAGLFDALSARLLESSGHERLAAAVRHPDARETLRGGIRGGAEMFDEHRDVFRVLFSMAHLDPEAVGGAAGRAEAVRAEGMASLARRLAEQGLLRAGVDARAAAHTLWLLASFDAFDVLRTARGLPLDEVVRILVETAEHALLAPG